MFQKENQLICGITVSANLVARSLAASYRAAVSRWVGGAGTASSKAKRHVPEVSTALSLLLKHSLFYYVLPTRLHFQKTSYFCHTKRNR